jgi:CheY-like chemotaxis protein
MASMAALWMCDLPSTEITGSDALNRSWVAEQQTQTLDGASTVGANTVGQALAGARILRVLVVDDEHDTTDSLVKLVSRWGHAARLAYDGAAGLKVAAAQHPDVVLLDIAMPRMDGFEVARQLRLDAPRNACYIIAVTGRGDDECRRKCQEADIDLMLIKPVESSLMKTILLQASQRVNRRWTDKQLGPTASFESEVETPAAVARDGVAETSRSRQAAGAGSVRQA